MSTKLESALKSGFGLARHQLIFAANAANMAYSLALTVQQPLEAAPVILSYLAVAQDICYKLAIKSVVVFSAFLPFLPY